jgi:hypothetical protein
MIYVFNFMIKDVANLANTSECTPDAHAPHVPHDHTRVWLRLAHWQPLALGRRLQATASLVK